MSHMEKISMILSEQAQQNALQLSLLMNIDRGSATEISINFTSDVSRHIAAGGKVVLVNEDGSSLKSVNLLGV